MKRFTSTAIATVFTGIFGTAAMADPAALLIGNEAYQSISRASNGVAAINTRWAFQRMGYAVTAGQDLRSTQLEVNLKALLEHAEPEDKIAIVLTGHFVTSGENTWFLLADANRPSMANISTRAIPLALIYDIAAKYPGQALIALGAANTDLPTGAGITVGIGRIDAPQGVTVITGSSGEMADFLTREALRKGVAMVDAIRNSRKTIYGHGFLPTTAPKAMDRPPIPTPNPKPDNRIIQERAYWQAVTDLGGLDAYQAYLKTYPRGIYADAARREIAFIKGAPERDARADEEALKLTRNDRRKIQSDLTVLGFDTRGIDGIFGAGTRGALSNWQADASYAQTGYINREQLITLRAQAKERNRILKEEAKRRKAELRRQDRAYWQETGQDGTELGLRSYLKRYPDGVFSDQAKEHLAAIQENKRIGAAKRERAIWDQTLAINTVAAYQQYLGQFPKGTFVTQALANIDALQNENSTIIAAAREEENRLGLAPVTFLLVEQRLSSMGYKPGRIDGKISKETRRAIRQFQDAANLPVTGYLSRATVVRLIAFN